jgi:hypothetical protein
VWATVLLTTGGPESPRIQVFHAVLYGLPRVLWMLIPLTAPRDLLGPPTGRRTLSAGAGLLVGGALFCGTTGTMPLRSLEGLFTGPAPALALLTPALTLLVAGLPALFRGRLRPAAVALAVSPVGAVALAALSIYLWDHAGALAFVPPAAAAATGVALVLAGRRRLRPSRH